MRVAIGPLCIALTLTTCFAAPRWKAIVATPALLFLSSISYNLYLWHLEIAVWLHGSGLPALAAAIIAVPVVVGVAALLTFRFEQPILNADLAAVRLALAARFARLRGTPIPIAVDVYKSAA